MKLSINSACDFQFYIDLAAIFHSRCSASMHNVKCSTLGNRKSKRQVYSDILPDPMNAWQNSKL